MISPVRTWRGDLLRFGGIPVVLLLGWAGVRAWPVLVARLEGAGKPPSGARHEERPSVERSAQPQAMRIQATPPSQPPAPREPPREPLAEARALASARLVFDIDPADAWVYLDGAKLGRAEELNAGVSVHSGLQILDVILPGFESHSAELVVVPQEIRRVEVKLKREDSETDVRLNEEREECDLARVEVHIQRSPDRGPEVLRLHSILKACGADVSFDPPLQGKSANKASGIYVQLGMRRKAEQVQRALEEWGHLKIYSRESGPGIAVVVTSADL